MEKTTRLLATAGMLGAAATGLTAAGCGTASRTVVVTAPPKVVTVTPTASSKVTASSKATASGAAATTTAAAPATTAPAAPADPAPTMTTAAAPLTNPSAVVTQFYQDISDGDYSAAWALGGDNLAGGASYATWVAGYQDTTSSITVEASSDWNSDTAYAEIDATQLDGTVKAYSGTYTVQNGVITSADITQTS